MSRGLEGVGGPRYVRRRSRREDRMYPETMYEELCNSVLHYEEC